MDARKAQIFSSIPTVANMAYREKIRTYLDGREFATLNDIWKDVFKLPVRDRDKTSSMAIVKVLKDTGWHKTMRSRVDHAQVFIYTRALSSTESAKSFEDLF